MSLMLALALLGCRPDAKDADPPGTDPIDTDTPPDTDTPSPDDTDVDPPATDAAAQEALDALEQAAEGPVWVVPGPGVPSYVHAIVPTRGGDPVEEAQALVAAYAPLFGLTDPATELHPQSLRQGPQSGAVRFRQVTPPELGGMPVFNAGITVHLDDTHAWGFSARLLRDFAPEAPVVPWRAVLRSATFTPAVVEPEVQGEPRLGVWVDWDEDTGRGTPYTVWRFVMQALRADGGGAVLWQVDVDAVSSDVRHVVPLTTNADKDFDIMFGDHESSISCWVFVDTQDWFDEDGELDEYSSVTDHNDDGIEAWGFAHDTWDWYWDNLGLCSYDDDDAEVEIVTHADLDGTIASASGYCGTIQMIDDGAGLDVIAHEFTHLVDYNHNDLEYESQSGALDESFADVFGSLIDGNWTIGESTGGSFRDLSNPPRFGHPDHMSPSVSGDGMGLRTTSDPNDDNDNGFVHTNSGIPNKAMFLITDGGSHNGWTIDGIGTQRARRLFHVVHTSGLDDEARFIDARHSMVSTALYWDAIAAHGFDGDAVCDVVNAWASVGVAASLGDADCDGNPDADDNDDDGDSVTDAYDNCPDDPNVMQSDVDGDGDGDDCDDDDDGDGDPDDEDNCPFKPNPDQADADGDDRGNLCDDEDIDGVLDYVDNCPGVRNWDQANFDGDAMGDACDPDMDGDGLLNGDDNCPLNADPDQADGDRDGVGDVCDNCPETYNPDQEDCNHNGIGTACDAPLDQIMCQDWNFAEEAAFVHPLDEVALPHVREELVSRLPDDYRLQLTVTGVSDPWMVVDHTGRVVARSESAVGTTGRVRTATWKPTLDYHFLRDDGTRADFGTTYHMSFSPLATDGAEVDFALEGVSR